MKRFKKVLFWVFAFVLFELFIFGLGYYLASKRQDLAHKEELADIETDYVKKAEVLRKTQRRLRNEIENLSRELSDVTNKNIKLVAEIDALVKKLAKFDQPSDEVTETSVYKEIYLGDTELKLAWARYHLDTKLWDVGNFRFSAQVNLVKSDGAYQAEVSLVQGDTKVPLKIDKFEILESSGFTWDPNVDLGLDYYFPSGFGGSVGISLFNWETKEHHLRFVHFGAYISQHSQMLTFSPVGYNVGAKVPLLNDLWVWPELGSDLQGFYFGISLKSNL